jgi:hypothetical protein
MWARSWYCILNLTFFYAVVHHFGLTILNRSWGITSALDGPVSLGAFVAPQVACVATTLHFHNHPLCSAKLVTQALIFLLLVALFRSVTQTILGRGPRSLCTLLSTSFTSAASPSPSYCRIIRATFCLTSTTLICLLSAGMVRNPFLFFSRAVGGEHLRRVLAF